MSNIEEKIIITNLSYAYDSGLDSILPVIDDISFSLDKGKFCSIVGQSGCGKTTLIKILSGLIKPKTGSVKIFGKSATDLKKEGKLGVVFQDPALLPWRSVKENIALPLEMRDVVINEQDILKYIKVVRLDDFAQNYPSELSGGMKSKTAIARALVLNPQLILMDEPFGALDELTAHKISMDFLRIWRESGATVIFVTHSINQAVLLSDKVIVGL